MPRLTDKDFLFDECDRNLFESCGWYAPQGVVVSAKGMLFHRIIMDTPTGLVCDHINGNRMDARRSNLRNITQKQNLANLHGKRKNNTSGYRGVYLQRGLWRAQANHNGKPKYLGCYIDPMFAAAVAATWRALFMEGANPKFV